VTTAHPTPAELEELILELLLKREPHGSICPSDAARAAGPDQWRELMDDVRAAAGRLADRGIVDVTQRGRVVDISRAHGPVRIRRHRQDDHDGRDARMMMPAEEQQLDQPAS
jgi:Protein of unknown function (DUF3253)